MRVCLFSVLFFACSFLLGQTTLNFSITQIPFEEGDFELELYQFSSGAFKKVHTVSVVVNDTTAIAKIIFPEDKETRLYQLKVTGVQNAAEFLFSEKENMTLSANLYDLMNGEIVIENSLENTAYGKLLQIMMEFESISEALEEESSSYSVYDHDFNAKVDEHAALVEEVHHKLNLNLEKIQAVFPETYTGQVLIPLSKIPIRHYNKEWHEHYDGYMSFLHDFFFYFMEVEDTRLLSHYAFQDKLFQYLNEYVDKNQDATEAAMSSLMNLFGESQEIQTVVYSQLMKTFIELDNEHFVNYLITEFGDGCGLDLAFEDLKRMNQMTSTNIGELAPDILLYDTDKEVQSLSKFATKNKLTAILFWVGWCEHCKNEIPKIIKLTEENKKKLGVFAVSLDATDEDWKSSMQSYSFPKNWVNVCEKVVIEKSSYAPLYNVSTTPSIYLIDEEGRIVAKGLKTEDLKELLEE